MSIFVDVVDCLDGDCSRDGRCYADCEESKHVDQEVDHGGQSPIGKDAPEGGQRGHARKCNTDDVKDNHGDAGDLEGALGVCDLFGPVNVVQGDPGRFWWVGNEMTLSGWSIR